MEEPQHVSSPTATTPPVMINGYLPVSFPFTPYSVQVDYMAAVDHSLTQQRHALLESPTGTGKTMCLLCASMAWLVNHKSTVGASIGGRGPLATLPTALRPPPPFGASMSAGGGGGPSTGGIQRIIYVSRTHAQLAQVIREFRSTAYATKVSMALLGSRDHMCVHPQVKQMTGTAANSACHRLRADHQCKYGNGVATALSNGIGRSVANRPAVTTANAPTHVGTDVVDMEDLVLLGQTRVFCPYFYQREKAMTADIIFAPYSYVLDPIIRQQQKIPTEGTALIIDEAHNVPSYLTSASTMTMTSVEFALCFEELQRSITVLVSREKERQNLNADAMFVRGDGGGVDASATEAADLAEKFLELIEFIKRLETRVLSFPLHDASNTAPQPPPPSGVAPTMTSSASSTAGVVSHPTTPVRPAVPAATGDDDDAIVIDDSPSLDRMKSGSVPAAVASAATPAAPITSSATNTPPISGPTDKNFPPDVLRQMLLKCNLPAGWRLSMEEAISLLNQTDTSCRGLPLLLRMVSLLIVDETQQFDPDPNWAVNVLGGGLTDYATRVKMTEAMKAMAAVEEAYRFVIIEESGDAPGGRQGGDRGRGVRMGATAAGGARVGNVKRRTIGLWCLDTSVAAKTILSGFDVVIMTSGTLSPLTQFAAEVGIPIGVTLQNAHVIDSCQLYSGILTRSPENLALTSAFATRHRLEYRTALGHTVINVARVVPDGMIVCFPSYFAMEEAITHWQGGVALSSSSSTSVIGMGGSSPAMQEVHGVGQMSFGPPPDSSTAVAPRPVAQVSTQWADLTSIKSVFIEPRDAKQLPEVIRRFQQEVDQGRGAILLAICRGKVAEGIDFSDRHGRCVIVTGIPYANAMDLFVKMKREYLNRIAMTKAPLTPLSSSSSSSSSSSMKGREPPTYFTGDEWYRTEAMRAVNQCIGRVIRHRNDFGAIVLADERFEGQRNLLSGWVKNTTKIYRQFGELYTSMSAFFATHRHRIIPGPRGVRTGAVAGVGALVVPPSSGGAAVPAPDSSVSATEYALQRMKEAEARKAEMERQASQAAALQAASTPTSGAAVATPLSSMGPRIGGAMTPPPFARAPAAFGAPKRTLFVPPSHQAPPPATPAFAIPVLTVATPPLAAMTSSVTPSTDATKPTASTPAPTAVTPSRLLAEPEVLTPQQFLTRAKERLPTEEYATFKDCLKEIGVLKAQAEDTAKKQPPSEGLARSVDHLDAVKFQEVVERLRLCFSKQLQPLLGVTPAARDGAAVSWLHDFASFLPVEFRPIYAAAVTRQRIGPPVPTGAASGPSIASPAKGLPGGKRGRSPDPTPPPAKKKILSI